MTKKTEKDFFTEADKKLIKGMLKGAPEHEIERFLRICERTGLDPFTRQIYGNVQRKKENDVWVPTLVIITSIDGLRAISESSGKYRGQTKPEWYYLNEENVLGWHDVFIPKRDGKGNPISLPEACRVGIHKENFVEPCYGVANFDSFAAWYKDGNDWVLNKFWKQMPEHMIAKVAEAAGHRKAFPLLMGQLYIEEEVKDEETEPVIPPRVQVGGVKVTETLPSDMKPADPVPPGESQKATVEPKTRSSKKDKEKAPETPAPSDPAPAPTQTAAPSDAAPEWMDYTLQFVKLPMFKGKKLSSFDLEALESLKSGWCEMNAAKIQGDEGREKERDMILAAFNARFDEMKAKK